MNEVMQSLLSRRSIRSFQNKQVEEEKLQLVLQAAVLAPNGRNQEPWHFTVLQNAEVLNKLDELVAGKGNTFFYHAPTLILVSIEEGNPYEQVNTACALTNMMQAAHALDLGSVWCNRINGNHEIDTKLTEYGVPVGYRVTGTLALGYCEGEYPSPREPKKGTINYIR
ncbi:MAG: nitroreductase family protein [Sphaerochaeta sp.]